MNRQADKRLVQELKEVTNANEAEALSRFAHSLTPERPARSRQAHEASWHMIESRIANEPASRRRMPAWLNWRMSLAPAALAALLLLMVALVFAQNSVPGNVSYGLKRGWEDVQLGLARTPTQKADSCSRQMKRRANELAQLSNAPSTRTATVRDLSASIVSEASEFDDYIRQSGANANQLANQRQRDITYAISALQTAQSQLHSQEQRKIIADTINTLRTDV